MNQVSYASATRPNVDSDIKTLTSERSIDVELKQLVGVVNSLNCRVDELAQRLFPIRRSVHAGSTATGAIPTAAAACQLSSAIREQRETLGLLDSRINALIDELEL